METCLAIIVAMLLHSAHSSNNRQSTGARKVLNKMVLPILSTVMLLGDESAAFTASDTEAYRKLVELPIRCWPSTDGIRWSSADESYPDRDLLPSQCWTVAEDFTLKLQDPLPDECLTKPMRKCAENWVVQYRLSLDKMGELLLNGASDEMPIPWYDDEVTTLVRLQTFSKLVESPEDLFYVIDFAASTYFWRQGWLHWAVWSISTRVFVKRAVMKDVEGKALMKMNNLLKNVQIKHTFEEVND